MSKQMEKSDQILIIHSIVEATKLALGEFLERKGIYATNEDMMIIWLNITGDLIGEAFLECPELAKRFTPDVLKLATLHRLPDTLPKGLDGEDLDDALIGSLTGLMPETDIHLMRFDTDPNEEGDNNVRGK